MIKGKAYINKGFGYQIHATDRVDEKFGVVVVDSHLDEFHAKITVFESGTVIIRSLQRTIEYNLKDGSLKCS
jgi:hypothetical protein